MQRYPGHQRIPPPTRESRIRTTPFGDPSRRYGAIVSLTGASLSAALVPTLFFSLYGIVGLILFAPGGIAALQTSWPRLERTRYALGCISGLGLLSLTLYGFAKSVVTSTSPAGEVFWMTILSALWCACLFALLRLAIPTDPQQPPPPLTDRPIA